VPTIFLNLKEFANLYLLPPDTFFTAVYFVNNMILPLANGHAQQLENMGCRKPHLHFDNSKCHPVRHVQERMTSHRCVRVSHLPYSPDLTIADFCLLGRLKQ
jgi:hypothetical protein